jgi:hypothetical protein
MFAARIRERLEKSPRLVKAKRAIWATSRMMLPRDDTRIINGLPLFTPNGGGLNQEPRHAHNRGRQSVLSPDG